MKNIDSESTLRSGAAISADSAANISLSIGSLNTDIPSAHGIAIIEANFSVLRWIMSTRSLLPEAMVAESSGMSEYVMGYISAGGILNIEIARVL